LHVFVALCLSSQPVVCQDSSEKGLIISGGP